MGEFIRRARRPDVLRRGLGYAISIAIKRGDRLLASGLDARRAVKRALTALVPFCVSIFSRAGALRSQPT